MKKSEIYKEAQKAIINAVGFTAETRLEMLKQLIHDEEFAIFAESLKESEADENAEL